MSKDSSSGGGGGGIGVVGLLGVVFVTLKLCHVIDWSWWWVTAPFWITAAFWIVIFAAAGGIIVFDMKKK
jgi:hypothetical protein